MGLFSSPQEDFIKAIQKGKIKEIDDLLKNKTIDLNLKDKNNLTPLEYSVLNAQKASFDKLIELGVKIEDPKELLKINISTNEKNEYKQSRQLFFREKNDFESNKEEITKELIQKYNADVDFGNSADFLRKLAYANTLGTMQILLNRKDKNHLDMNATTTKENKTILTIAVEENWSSHIKTLVKAGANINETCISAIENTQYQYKKDLLAVAFSNDSLAAAKELLDNGLKVSPSALLELAEAEERAEDELSIAKAAAEDNSASKGLTTTILTGSLVRGLAVQALSRPDESDESRYARATRDLIDIKKLSKYCQQHASASAKTFVNNYLEKREEEKKENATTFVQDIVGLFKHKNKEEKPVIIMEYKEENINKLNIKNKIKGLREKVSEDRNTKTSKVTI